MNKSTSSEAGFNAAEVVLVIVTASLICAVGWLVYRNYHKALIVSGVKTSSNTAAISTKGTTPREPSPSLTVPASVSTPTNAPLQACDAANFTVRLSTNKKSYSSGEDVQITVSIANTGPPCTGVEDSGPCANSVTITDSSGREVWDSEASPYGEIPIACPALVTETTPSGWNESDRILWDQDRCAPPSSLGTTSPSGTNPECPMRQTPPGIYYLIAQWQTNQSSKSAPVTITIK